MVQRQSSETDAARGQWSSRSIGSRFQHNIFYLLIRIGGRRAAYLLLYFVVFYYMAFCPAQRAKTRPYLNRRFAGRRGWRAFLDSHRMSLELGKVLVDRAVVGILGPDSMEVSLQGREELLALKKQGKGVILLTSHIGCWQVSMSALGYLRTRVHMLMRQEDGNVDRHYFEHAGITCPYRIIDPTGYLGGTLEMMSVLKAGEVLGVMGDRVLGSDKSAVATDFLGEPARFPFSAYHLASATGAPIVVLFTCKTGPCSYEMKVGRVIRVPAGLGRNEEAYRPYVSQYAQALEEFTEDYPYQFFNFFDMWKQ